MVHDTLKPHYFSSDAQVVIRGWMKALIKANIVTNHNGEYSLEQLSTRR
jgi:cytochrome c-type biogenesis protein CcmE